MTMMLRTNTSWLVNIWYISPAEVRNSSVDVNFEVAILQPTIPLSEDRNEFHKQEKFI